MSDEIGRTDVVDRLVKLIEKLKPLFLDSSGQAYCTVGAEQQNQPLELPLRDWRVRSYLMCRYKTEHGDYARRDRVADAIDYCVGNLFDQRKEPLAIASCPIVRCFLRLVEARGDGAGSADDLLRMLRKVATRPPRLLKGGARLPKNATAMGIWLVRRHLALRAYGIELDRPPRGSTKRLWSWRQIVRNDDACDTSASVVSSSNPIPGNEDQLSDASLENMFKEVLP